MKKLITLFTTALLAGFCIAQDCCTNRWWQIEIPTPSYNQVINPSYSAKKRELEITCDDLREDLRAIAHFRSLGQETTGLDEGARHLERKIRTLEYELEQIPMYITKDPSNENVPQGDININIDINTQQEPNKNDVIYTPSQSSGNSDEGIVRINFAPFPYINDDYDWRGYNRLGPVSAYVIEIYSDSIMHYFKMAYKSSIRIFGTRGRIGINEPEKFKRIVVAQARQLLDKDSRNSIERLFMDGGGMTFIVQTPTPPFIDIPLPHGKYFLAYSVVFLESKNPNTELVHPNYPNKPSDLSSIKWGPAELDILSGKIVNIEFQPTNNVNFYSDYSIKRGWLNSTAFWDYMDYLFWSGAVY